MLRGFSGGKQEIKSANTKMQSSLFDLHNRKEVSTLNETKIAKYGWKGFWMQYTTVEVFTARNYDVKLVELHILHFAWLESSSYFGGINKLDRDYSITRLGNFDTCLPSNCSYPINPKVRAKVECNMNKVYHCLYSSISFIVSSWNVFLQIKTSKRYQ